jgi:hypothetical protein
LNLKNNGKLLSFSKSLTGIPENKFIILSFVPRILENEPFLAYILQSFLFKITSLLDDQVA